MSDEGEDIGNFEQKLNNMFERKRLIQSSHDFRDRIKQLEKLNGYHRESADNSSFDSIFGCGFTKEMNEMKLSYTEYSFILDFLAASSESIKAESKSMEALSNPFQKSNDEENKLKNGKSVEFRRAALVSANEELERCALRLILMDIFIRLHTSKSGSALTWFSLLFPQMKKKQPVYYRILSEQIHPYFEKSDKLIETLGLEHCLHKYIIDTLN